MPEQIYGVICPVTSLFDVWEVQLIIGTQKNKTKQECSSPKDIFRAWSDDCEASVTYA